jgi:hypothetical protein
LPGPVKYKKKGKKRQPDECTAKPNNLKKGSHVRVQQRQVIQNENAQAVYSKGSKKVETKDYTTGLKDIK